MALRVIEPWSSGRVSNLPTPSEASDLLFDQLENADPRLRKRFGQLVIASFMLNHDKNQYMLRAARKLLKSGSPSAKAFGLQILQCPPKLRRDLHNMTMAGTSLSASTLFDPICQFVCPGTGIRCFLPRGYRKCKGRNAIIDKVCPAHLDSSLTTLAKVQRDFLNPNKKKCSVKILVDGVPTPCPNVVHSRGVCGFHWTNGINVPAPSLVQTHKRLSKIMGLGEPVFTALPVGPASGPETPA